MTKLPSWVRPSTVLPLLAKRPSSEGGWAVLESGEFASLVYLSRDERCSPSMQICFDWACSNTDFLRIALDEESLSPSDRSLAMTVRANLRMGGVSLQPSQVTLFVLGFRVSLRLLPGEEETEWVVNGKSGESVLVLGTGYRHVLLSGYEDRGLSAIHSSLETLHREVLGRVPDRLTPIIEAMESLIS